MSFIADDAAEMQVCELCEEGTVSLKIMPLAFTYGSGASAVELVAEVPAWECNKCGETYTAEGAEAAQHDRICEHFERLKPSEIVAMRNRLGLTQYQFAERLGISRASVARWETGAQVQSAFYDLALRRELEKVSQIKIQNVFRTDVSDRRAAACAFNLRLMAA